MLTTPSSDLLTRAVADIVTRKELEAKLATGKKLRIYLGADPSRPDLHIGHAVILQRLRDFQALGHKIIFLIGDFTARIGDPTDRLAERQPMTSEQVKKNAQTYLAQVGKILDMRDKKNPVEITYNSAWLGKLDFGDILGLSAHFTVSRLLERDMFQKRIKEGKEIALTEFLYPVMQAYDAVELDVDMQVGGTDQLFNMLAGRHLAEKLGKKNQCVMTFELLPGTDGRKMSKSYDNYIALTDSANEMFGKVMSLRDELIVQYFTLATRVPLEEIAAMEKAMRAGENPRDFKARLGREIVAMYYSAEAAVAAEAEFNKVFQKKERPSEMTTVRLADAADKSLLGLMVAAGLASSKSEGRRKFDEGAVRVNDAVVKKWDAPAKSGDVVQIGKRKFAKVL